MRKILDVAQLKTGETPQVRFPHGPAQAQLRRPTLPFHFDQTGFGKLPDVMRDGRGADRFLLAQTAAGHAFGPRHLLENGEAAPVGQRTRNGVELVLGQLLTGWAAFRGHFGSANRRARRPAAIQASGFVQTTCPVTRMRPCAPAAILWDRGFVMALHMKTGENSQRADKQLAVPSAAAADPAAFELLRVWVAHQAQQVTLRPGVWQEPSAWGVMLADLARSIVKIHAENDAELDGDAFLSALLEGFDNEIESVLEEFGEDDEQEHEAG